MRCAAMRFSGAKAEDRRDVIDSTLWNMCDCACHLKIYWSWFCREWHLLLVRESSSQMFENFMPSLVWTPFPPDFLCTFLTNTSAPVFKVGRSTPCKFGSPACIYFAGIRMVMHKIDHCIFQILSKWSWEIYYNNVLQKNLRLLSTWQTKFA